jgi:hypothetical protein
MRCSPHRFIATARTLPRRSRRTGNLGLAEIEIGWVVRIVPLAAMNPSALSLAGGNRIRARSRDVRQESGDQQFAFGKSSEQLERRWPQASPSVQPAPARRLQVGELGDVFGRFRRMWMAAHRAGRQGASRSAA